MSTLVSKEARCPTCQEAIYFWTEQVSPDENLQIARVLRRCQCPVDVEELVRTARLILPQFARE